MKILNIVIAKVWGGGEQYVYDTAKVMRDRNIEVFIAVDKTNVELQKKFAEVANVILFDLYTLAGMNAFIKIKEFIEKNNISIINCHSGHAMLLCMCLKLTTCVKLVVFKHNALYGKHDFYHNWQRKHTDAFICVSRLVYEMQVDKLKDEEKKKFYLVYNGIDIEKFGRSDSECVCKNNEFTIGYAGRIAFNKGIDVLLEAFCELVKKYPKMRLLLAGADEKGYLSELRKYIYENDLGDRVEYLGYINDMEAFYKRLNVFVLPSVVKEAFGLVLCEAMYCGPIVITTDSGAQQEIVENGVDGYIVKSDDSKALECCIEDVYLNIDTKRNLIDAAKNKVIDRFSAVACVNGLLSIYGKLQKC